MPEITFDICCITDGEFSSDGTSYESYDEEDSVPVYENQVFHENGKGKSRYVLYRYLKIINMQFEGWGLKERIVNNFKEHGG